MKKNPSRFIREGICCEGSPPVGGSVRQPADMSPSLKLSDFFPDKISPYGSF
ncbi:MAG TPA: hypothetical protein VGZ90_14610 [Puia sp.]|nr:hypothetical protein [Puia sp.]